MWIVAALATASVASLAAKADVLSVPSGGGRLAAMAAAAAPGDTLVLEAGVHRGPVVIRFPLTVQGKPGAVVDGAGQGRVITISAPKTVVRALTVRNSGTRLDTMDAGIYIDKGGTGALVENNRLENNLFGVYVQGPKGAVVRGNTIIGRSDLRMSERGNGVQLWNTPGTIVEGNTVRFGRDGIFVTTSKKNVFRNNRFSDLRFAVHYMYTNRSEISGNLSERNHVGYAIMYSHRLKVSGNRSTGDRDHGILLNYANRSTIEDNVVRHGKTKCVFVYNAHKNIFRRNWFEGCGVGIHFTAGSERNVITANAFIGNRTQVKYVGTRWLEWSARGRGNYWSDNPAFDLDGDGIADTAYRPNDLVDQIVWRAPSAKILLTSPAIQMLRWAQSQFPGLYPGGVIDSAPLMAPPTMRESGTFEVSAND
jgi:nitrous oxidase accessory protein